MMNINYIFIYLFTLNQIGKEYTLNKRSYKKKRYHILHIYLNYSRTLHQHISLPRKKLPVQFFQVGTYSHQESYFLYILSILPFRVVLNIHNDHKNQLLQNIIHKYLKIYNLFSFLFLASIGPLTIHNKYPVYIRHSWVLKIYQTEPVHLNINNMVIFQKDLYTQYTLNFYLIFKILILLLIIFTI